MVKEVEESKSASNFFSQILHLDPQFWHARSGSGHEALELLCARCEALAIFNGTEVEALAS